MKALEVIKLLEKQGTLRIARAQMRLLIECPGVSVEALKTALSGLIGSVQADESTVDASKLVSVFQKPCGRPPSNLHSFFRMF